MKVDMNKEISFKIFKGYRIYGLITIFTIGLLLITIIFDLQPFFYDWFLIDESLFYDNLYYFSLLLVLISMIFGLIWFVKSWKVRHLLNIISKILFLLYFLLGLLWISVSLWNQACDSGLICQSEYIEDVIITPNYYPNE